MTNLNEDTVYIGDIHQIGSVILEVTQPREPCWKIGQKFKHKEFTKYIYDTGETGWYYRVLQEGKFQINDDVFLIKEGIKEFSIREANNILRDVNHNIKLTKQLINLDILGEPFRKSLKKKIN